MKKVKFDDWRIRTFRRKEKYGWSIEKIRYRTFKIDKHRRLEEGKIIEFKEKLDGEDEFKDTQQHLIGYWYLSLIKDGKDLVWIQKYKGSRDTMLGIGDESKDWTWYKSKDEALSQLKNILKFQYRLVL